MSIQEIEAAIAKLPLEQLRALSAWLARLLAGSGDLSTNPKHMEGFGESASSKRLKERKALVNAARQHWKGGEGLAYQDRIRSEWDDRPTGDA